MALEVLHSLAAAPPIRVGSSHPAPLLFGLQPREHAVLLIAWETSTARYCLCLSSPFPPFMTQFLFFFGAWLLCFLLISFSETPPSPQRSGSPLCTLTKVRYFIGVILCPFHHLDHDKVHRQTVSSLAAPCILTAMPGM